MDNKLAILGGKKCIKEDLQNVINRNGFTKNDREALKELYLE